MDLIEEALKDHEEFHGYFKPVDWCAEKTDKMEILNSTEAESDEVVVTEPNLFAKIGKS